MILDGCAPKVVRPVQHGRIIIIIIIRSLTAVPQDPCGSFRRGSMQNQLLHTSQLRC